MDGNDHEWYALNANGRKHLLKYDEKTDRTDFTELGMQLLNQCQHETAYDGQIRDIFKTYSNGQDSINSGMLSDIAVGRNYLLNKCDGYMSYEMAYETEHLESRTFDSLLQDLYYDSYNGYEFPSGNNYYDLFFAKRESSSLSINDLEKDMKSDSFQERVNDQQSKYLNKYFCPIYK